MKSIRILILSLITLNLFAQEQISPKELADICQKNFECLGFTQSLQQGFKTAFKDLGAQIFTTSKAIDVKTKKPIYLVDNWNIPFNKAIAYINANTKGDKILTEAATQIKKTNDELIGSIQLLYNFDRDDFLGKKTGPGRELLNNRVIELLKQIQLLIYNLTQEKTRNLQKDNVKGLIITIAELLNKLGPEIFVYNKA